MKDDRNPLPLDYAKPRHSPRMTRRDWVGVLTAFVTAFVMVILLVALFLLLESGGSP